MKSLVKFFTERPLLVSIVTLTVLFAGLVSLAKINREEFPNVTTGTIRVSARYQGASPQDVELNVTNKIEDALKGVNGIAKMTSTSSENSSTIIITIDENEEEKKVYNDIVSAVNGLKELPDAAERPQVMETTPNRVAMRIGLSSKKLSYRELREYAREFEKKLKDIPALGTISTDGLRNREIRIEVSPDKMVQYGISLSDVINALKLYNIRSAGGSIESYTDQKNVITLSKFTTPEEARKLIIRASQGGILYLKDIAEVIDGFAEETSVIRVNGASAITFTIAKRSSADIIEAAQAVKNLIKKEQEVLGPALIEFLTIRDDSKSVNDKFEIVKSNGITGLFLVLFVLSLFFNVRVAFWVAMGIPFSLLGVIATLPFFGIELDSITLASMIIVLGIIVDDAIVIVENIFQKRDQGQEALEAIMNGVGEVALPVFTTVATTIIAFLPMLLIPGRLGKFIYVIPYTVIISLTISMCESYFILPGHISHGLKSSQKASRQWFGPFRAGFARLLTRLLPLRYVWLFGALLLLVFTGLFTRHYVKFKLFDRGRTIESINVTVEMAIGTSLQATLDKAKEVEKVVEAFPKDEIVSYYTRIGSGGFRGSSGTHLATLSLYLVVDSKLKRTGEQITEDLRKKLSSIKGAKNLAIGATTRGYQTGRPLEIMIKGQDGKNRQQAIQAVQSFLAGIGGVSDVELDVKYGKEEINIIPNYLMLAKYGLTVSDIARTVGVTYDGEIATVSRYGDEDVNFKVIMRRDFRQNIIRLKELKIRNAKGDLISLEEVAKFEISRGIHTIYHENGEPTVTLTAEVDQSVITPLEVMDLIKDHFDFSQMRNWLGIRIDVGGEAAESREAIINILMAFGLAALGIYFLLVLLFNSLLQPLNVLLIIPFGVCGVILAYGLHGELQITFFGGIGIIGLVGVVVNDALVMIDHLNSIVAERPENFIEAVVTGTADRLRPVILTTATTVFGLLPLIYGIGGKDAMMSPMALSLGYGLLFVTPITLILLPCLYVAGQDIKNLMTKLKEIIRRRKNNEE